MKVQVHFQGLEATPWLEEFIDNRLAKLDRYLNSSASIQVHLRFENRLYTTGLSIYNHHGHSFSANGENLYESFSAAVDKAARVLGEEKRQLKDKINRKYFSIKRVV